MFCSIRCLCQLLQVDKGNLLIYKYTQVSELKLCGDRSQTTFIVANDCTSSVSDITSLPVVHYGILLEQNKAPNERGLELPAYRYYRGTVGKYGTPRPFLFPPCRLRVSFPVDFYITMSNPDLTVT
jgi:hypothetical protein